METITYTCNNVCVVFSSSSKVNKDNFKDGEQVYSRIKNKKYAQLNLHLLDILWKNSCDCNMQSCAYELHTSPTILRVIFFFFKFLRESLYRAIICKESTTLKEIQQP